MYDDEIPGIFHLFDKIDIESAKEVVSWIMAANMADVKLDYLTLVVFSEGGDLSAAFAIIDTMRGSNIPVRTVAMGEVMSSGLMVFMAGQKGYRTIMPNTTAMSHTFSGSYDGKIHDLNLMQEEFKTTHERMVKLYMECTGLSRAKIEQHLLNKDDVWLTAEQTIEFKMADIMG